ncbi:MAG: hypothetical protein HQL65_19330 [Magnetococcales bacterium]|nr:hypothetical protein [Magnetococcales bacterium]
MEPETSATMKPETPVTPEPETPVSQESETPVTPKPETQVTRQPEMPVMIGPETPVAGSRDPAPNPFAVLRRLVPGAEAVDTGQGQTQKDFVVEADLGAFQRLRPGAEPVPRPDGTVCWHARDVEPLRTRKSWKKQGRRVRDQEIPARESVQEEGIQRLFALSQTLTEQEYLLTQKERIQAHCVDLGRQLQLLLQALSTWENQDLPQAQPPEAEEALRGILTRLAELQERGRSLSETARLLGIEVPQPDFTSFDRAMELFRQRRFQAIIAAENPEDGELATLIDRRLTERERQAAEPFHLLPYWKYYAQFYKTYEETRFEREVEAATRIREFHLLFPARRRERKFTFFLGPTNSGKTYQALQLLAAAENGIYLAPLRLLAQEVAQTLNEWGIPCNLITGEERLPVPGAKHTASTIEMLSLHEQYALCVIDEAQMLGDADRGWAWTQAVLGVQAGEVCVVGAPESLPVLEKLLKLTGEIPEVVHLERLAPLRLLSHPVRDHDALKPGTAMVAFSRTAVLGLKRELEERTGQRVAVIYGALPPEIRRNQARLFASGEAPFLAATDAIGMGLNLPIRTLLFCEDRKFIDRQEHPLTPLEVRQIAGRAGRFGQNEIGFVGTFRISMEHIRTAYHAKPLPVRRAHLAPNLDHVLAMATLRDEKNPKLARLLALFLKSVKPDPRTYQLADLEDQTILARIADGHGNLDLPTRFIFSSAPVPVRSHEAMAAFTIMVATVAHHRSLHLDEILPTHMNRFQRLVILETTIRIVDLYCWLHFRFPGNFPDLEEAQAHRHAINGEIDRLLGQKRPGSQSNSPEPGQRAKSRPPASRFARFHRQRKR